MKSFIQIILGACLFLTCVSTSAQENATIKITLNVNTADITRSTVNESADFGQAKDRISNEDFTVNVKIGNMVIWNGISTSSEDDIVEIVSINHEGGARLFDRNVLNGEDGIVAAVVSKGKVGDNEKYTIKFRVYRNGQRLPGIFQIDPKLVVKQ